LALFLNFAHAILFSTSLFPTTISAKKMNNGLLALLSKHGAQQTQAFLPLAIV
jgi:hypothetical protein